MPDLHELLDRTTPTDLSPVDVGAVAMASRHRRSRRRARTLVAGVAALGLLAAGAVTAAHRPSDNGQQVTAAAPDTRTLTDGMGTWSRLPDAPVTGLRSLAPLSDGRLLAWGDERAGFVDNEDPGDVGLVAAVYDPDKRTWTAIDRPAVLDAIQLRSTLVAGDRLMAFGLADDGTFRGAVLDTDVGAWTAIPVLPDMKVTVDAVAWDGTTLTAVRTNPGEVGRVGTGGLPHDVSDPNDGVVTLDWRVKAPLTRRWDFGSQVWTDGTPPPLTMRIATGSAFDGRRLAIVGGTEGPPGTDDRSLTRSDGAIYDVASNTWQHVPDLPWAAADPDVAWIDGALVAAGGRADLNGEHPIARAAELDPDASAWTPLPSPPKHGAGVTWRSAWEHFDGGEPLVQTSSFVGDPAAPEGSVLLDSRWEATPTRTLHRWDGLLVASSDRIGNPGDSPFEIEVRRRPDDWVPVAKALFANRMAPGVAVKGDRIYVVGGLTGTAVEPDASAWVLDLSMTR